jgi:hypothetical protein
MVSSFIEDNFESPPLRNADSMREVAQSLGKSTISHTPIQAALSTDNGIDYYSGMFPTNSELNMIRRALGVGGVHA